MDRITRKVGDSIELIDGKGYANLSQEESVRLVYERLYECEERIFGQERMMTHYFELVEWLYKQTDKPIEIKSAILWGALSILNRSKQIDWDTMRNMYGEFMSKQMNLR